MRILKVGFFGAFRVLAFAVLPFLTSPFASATDVTLIPKGATWKYLDGNVDPGTGWEAPAFDDSSWGSGPGPLGWGDTHIRTSVDTGPDGARYPTVLFRKSFAVSSAGGIHSLTLNLLRDDGALIFLNGTQVVADGVGTPFSFGAWATQTVGGTDETSYFTRVIPVSALVDGQNVIAVASKQVNAASSDLGFDLELIGTSEITVSLNAPAADATEVPIPATLSAVATHPTGASTDVRFYGRPAPVASAQRDFTIIALPDTQNYTASVNGGTPAMFVSQTEWIRASRGALNIAYVAQLGDISNNGDSYESQWANASEALYRLETDGIPYGAAVGNHDQMVPGGDTSPTTFYNQYFGVSHFAGRSYYGGHSGANNNNHYDLFTAGGMDFIAIYFEYDTTPDAAVLQWADALLKTYNNRRAIVVSHYLLELSGAWGYQGQSIYNALKTNPNVFLMLCGHNHGESQRTDVYSGNTINTLLADYQSEPGGGNGYLRILQFSPTNNEIHVSTYSPFLGQYRFNSTQFTLSYDMRVAGPFTQIQANADVPSGTQITATWAGLENLTEYEWYVEASDGTATGISEIRHFTTTLGVAPAAPTGLSATPNSSTSVALSWIDNANNESSFEIETSLTDVGDFSLAGSLPANTTAAVVNGLIPGTAYYFRVRAVNGAGNSDDSNVSTATTLPANHKPVAVGQTVSTYEDEPIPVTLQATDADQDSLVYSIVNQPGHGTLTLAGKIATYAPAPNYAGPDSFTFRAFDGEDYSEPADVSINVSPVNDPPSAPPNLAASAASGLVTLSWTASTDSEGDPVSYQVYRSESSGSYGAPLTTVSALTYTDAAVVNGTTYFYQIVAVDPGGAKSTASTEVFATPDLLPVDVFVGQNPVLTSGTLAGEYAATFAADGAVQTITEAGTSTGAHLQADYTLITSANPSGIISLSLFLTAQWSSLDGTTDSLVVSILNQSVNAWEPITAYIQEGGKFDAAQPQNYISADGAIRVRFVDSASFRREKKDTLMINQLFARILSVAPDTTPPSAPVALSATPGESRVQLDWADNTEEDLAGYNIYRSEEGANYQKVNLAPVMENTYVDSGLVNGTTYSYALTAVDQSSNESSASEATSATPVDGPPAAPAGLTATAGAGQVQLDWADNPEPDVTGYNVYRWNGTDWNRLTLDPITTSPYLDTGVQNGTVHTYYITAVDPAYESAASTTVSATPIAQATMHVEAITMKPPMQSGKSYKASGTAFVVTPANEPLAGAVVTGGWWFNSSLLQTQTVATDSNGAAAFTSPPVKAASGATFTLRITGVVLSGYVFNPSDGITEATSQVP